MKKINQKIYIFVILFLLIPAVSFAQIVGCGHNQAGENQNPCTIGDLIGTIKYIINFLLSWAWLVAIFLIVVSGFRMIIARGDTEAISSAKTSLNNAIMGFIIILLSFIILNLVVG